MIPNSDFNQILDGKRWKQMIRAGAQVLGERKQEVDALNVFPVPDGDTGTNMHLTIQSAVRDAEKISDDSVAEIAVAVSTGSLMGARGNSGVILSQLLRGMAKGLEGLKTANSLQVAQALQMGVDTAYKAVMKPVEGTILTVAREAARAALNEAKQGSAVLQTLQAAYRKGEETLAKTPDMLPALKQAGVVDAGGKGFLVILSGWIAGLEGKIPAGAAEKTAIGLPEEANMARIEAPAVKGFIELENLEYPYCTEFLVKGHSLSEEKIRHDLTDQGDCLLVVGKPEVVKIHIHTKNPGKILDDAIQWGSLHEVQIHNMLAQNEAMAHALKEQAEMAENPASGQKSSGTISPEMSRDTEKDYGVVAVAMGEGIAEVFKSLGADEVIFGGQTMNPSTEDLVEAVRRVKARNIFILPNNGNIVMAARQVIDVVGDNVHVIPSKSIPQGIAALFNLESESTLEDNLGKMEKALSGIGSGEVTYAVRDSQFGELDIQSGDILGLVDDTIVTTGNQLLMVTQATLEKMEWQEHDLVTIFYGQEVADTEAERLREWLEQENPQVEVEIHPGGQPLYYFIIGVE